MNPRIRSRLQGIPLGRHLPSVEELRPITPPLERLSPEARRLLASEGLGSVPIARAPRRAEAPALPPPPPPTNHEVFGLLQEVGPLQGDGVETNLARALPQERRAALRAELAAVSRMAEAVAELAGLRRRVDLCRTVEGPA